MRARILVALVVSVVGLSGCGPDAPAGSGGGDVRSAQDALAALRKAGSASLSATVVHRFLDSGEPKEVRETYGGTFQADGGSWGDTVHFAMEVPADEGKTQTLHRWDLGEVTVMPNFVFERDEDDPPPLPWRVWPEGSQERHPSVLSAFTLIERGSGAEIEGTERKDGVALKRWRVTVPAEEANAMFRHDGYSGTAISCSEGLPLTVWIDEQGRLRRIRLLTEQYDGDTFEGEFSFDDLGRRVGADAAPPPQDQMVGEPIDPEQRAAKRAESRRQAEANGAQLNPAPDPCTPSDEKPTEVDRSRCTPSSKQDFVQVDLRGRYTPGGKAKVHLRLKEHTPAPIAFDVPENLQVVNFDTTYIGPGGWDLTRSANGLPPDFDPTDQAAVRALLSVPERGEQAPADIGLRGIWLEGTWADLAVEASNCRYEAAST